MDAEFIALAARPGRPLTAEQQALVASPSPAPLPFEPTDHLGWRSPDGSVAFGAWQRIH
ncbi:MAG: hypothetical protein JO291_13855, partial [Acidimicrobiia bacterium]|nr:hypothetical protein [Acidimicrobiia bacterium]